MTATLAIAVAIGALILAALWALCCAAIHLILPENDQ